MKQVIYSSTTSRALTTDNLLPFLEQARTVNASYGLTGILLTQGRSLLQAIEGPEPYISSIFSRILRDHRHHNINILSVKQIDHREFGDQSMAHLDATVSNAAPDDALADLRFRPLLAVRENVARRYLLAASHALRPESANANSYLPFTHYKPEFASRIANITSSNEAAS